MRLRLAMRRQQLGKLQWLGLATLRTRQMVIVRNLHTLESPSCAQAHFCAVTSQICGYANAYIASLKDAAGAYI